MFAVIQDSLHFILLCAVDDLWGWSCWSARAKCLGRGSVWTESIDMENIMDLHSRWELQAEGDWGVLLDNGVWSHETCLEFSCGAVLICGHGDVFCVE